jgi:hypothetical protein
MATWTNISDTVLEPGKPARSIDALALRDNPIAIAERTAGAPWQNIGNVTTLTSSGTWTVPAGVYRIIVTCIGGGQGGGVFDESNSIPGKNGGNTIFGGITASGGKGDTMSGWASCNGGRGRGANGMGGQIIKQSLAVTPNQTISYTIGGGGAGYTTYGTPGGNGVVIIEW